MKFSWELLNIFINLKHINFNEFRNQLTLSGLEIEKVNEKIIDISITSNRKEISSAFTLARETSSIFGIPLKILPVNTTNYLSNIKGKTHNSKNITYVRRISLKKNYTNHTPDWLLSQLKMYDIENKNLITNIQQYIKLKWGETFKIIDNKDEENNNPSKQITQIIIFTKKINTNNCLDEFYENMYIDSIKLISTSTKIYIGKYNETYEKVIATNNEIKINKENINKLLGQIDEKRLKFIETHTIINILEQLNLYPQYKRLEKSFVVKIPNYRKHDLNREVDIIEEIGRIYKFQHFFKKIKRNNLGNSQSKNFVKTKMIRQTLQNLGLHEVMNCCLNNNYVINKNNVTLYNPISNEQKELRNNILENIINNYNENIKQSQKSIEIFEIGKTFEKNGNKYKEIQKIGGLIYNAEYIKYGWQDKSQQITLFHFKNILETFLEKINSTAILKNVVLKDNSKNFVVISHLFNNNRKLGIYDTSENKIIGLIGEINKNYIQSSKNKKIYIFEINLLELIKTIENKDQLQYIIKKYSNYPSVTRDISVKLKKHENIEKIKKILLYNNNFLIESVKIISEYKITNKYRSISLRITYRSISKTLSKDDVKYIDENLEKTLKKLEQFK